VRSKKYPVEPVSIDSGTKSVTYNGRLSTGKEEEEEEEKKTLKEDFLFYFIYSPFTSLSLSRLLP
jgi:hypothetical protein